MPHHAHTNEEDVNCEAAKGSWPRRNITLQTILTMIVIIGGLLVAVYAFVGKVDAGAAATKVSAIERDYVSKRDLEITVGPIKAEVRSMSEKMDALTIEIIKRLPDK